MWAKAIQLCPPLYSFSLVVRDSRQVTDALLPIGLRGPMDAFGVRSGVKIESPPPRDKAPRFPAGVRESFFNRRIILRYREAINVAVAPAGNSVTNSES